MNRPNRLRGALRLVRLFLYTLRFLIYTLWRVRGGLTVAEGLELRRHWSAGFIRRLGFQVTWEGTFPEDETCLFIGNHRSSLDPQVLMSRIKAYPVSRAEVRNWPLVGKGASVTGIIFVDKSSRESRLRAKTALLEEMQKGHSVLIFPEGHTNVEPTTVTFNKGAFEQAAAGGFRVVPFVIEYEDTRDYWDHTDNFAVHLMKRFGKPYTNILVRFGEPAASDNGWTLLRQSQAWIDENIVDVRRRWEKG